jgi:hypothetical protein
LERSQINPGEVETGGEGVFFELGLYENMPLLFSFFARITQRKSIPSSKD